MSVNKHIRYLFRNSPTLDSISNSSENRELTELKCNELQWTKQADLLRAALSELGCEEAPSGCPDPATPPSSPPCSPAHDDHQVYSLKSHIEFVYMPVTMKYILMV